MNAKIDKHFDSMLRGLETAFKISYGDLVGQVRKGWAVGWSRDITRQDDARIKTLEHMLGCARDVQLLHLQQTAADQASKAGYEKGIRDGIRQGRGASIDTIFKFAQQVSDLTHELADEADY